MDRINKVVLLVAVTVLSFCLTSEIQAGAGIDENILQELRNLIEQQQKQLDRQGAEIARLKEQLGGAAEEIEQKADKTELKEVSAEKMVTSSFHHVDVNLYG